MFPSDVFWYRDKNKPLLFFLSLSTRVLLRLLTGCLKLLSSTRMLHPGKSRFWILKFGRWCSSSIRRFVGSCPAVHFPGYNPRSFISNLNAAEGDLFYLTFNIYWYCQQVASHFWILDTVPISPSSDLVGPELDLGMMDDQINFFGALEILNQVACGYVFPDNHASVRRPLLQTQLIMTTCFHFHEYGKSNFTGDWRSICSFSPSSPDVIPGSPKTPITNQASANVWSNGGVFDHVLRCFDIIQPTKAEKTAVKWQFLPLRVGIPVHWHWKRTNSSPEKSWLVQMYSLLKQSLFRRHFGFCGCTFIKQQFWIFTSITSIMGKMVVPLGCYPS